MNEQSLSALEAATPAAPAIDVGAHRAHDGFQACSGPFARVASLIVSQPGDVDLSELLRRLRRREL